MDFFRNTPGTYSRLGSLLADQFSESLSGQAAGFKVMERGDLHEFLFADWTTLNDLQSSAICLAVAREMGASVVVLGTMQEENGKLHLTLHLEGFGSALDENDRYLVEDERGRLGMSEDLRMLLFEPGPDYKRQPDTIPEETGILKAGIDGVGSPVCVYCPPPNYPLAAVAASYQGSVVLSVIVNAEGEVESICIVKPAPFGLTRQSLDAVKLWRMKPAMKDGQPVPTRVEIETTFHG